MSDRLADNELVCCVCLYVKGGKPHEAVTVIRGYAVCDDHTGLVAQGTEWAAILNIAREQEAE